MLIGVSRFMAGDADRSDAGGIIDALAEPENAFRRVIMIREGSFDALDLNVLEPRLIQHFARGLRSAHVVLRRDGGIFTVGGADTGLRPESEDHGDDYEQEIGLHAASFRLTRGFPAFFLSGFHKFWKAK